MSYLSSKALQYFTRIKKGELVWIDGSTHHFGHPYNNLSVVIEIHRQRFYKKFILRGSLGAAESYMDGDWSCSNLTQLMQIIIENQAVLASLDNKGWSIFSNSFRLIKNIFNVSHIKKSRKNILYHYDLSNKFFSLFLDNSMLYSCAMFNSPQDDLARAQQHKMQIICEKLKLSPADHLLEIGSGWGSLAIYAAQNYGCRVTATTISDAQYDYMAEKIQTLGLQQKIDLLKKDYRELVGQYDKIVSIEMIESIGYHYFNKYFAVCNQLLKEKGIFLLQTITIRDQEYNRYKKEADFIKTYIFPGGCLPCIETISRAIKKKTTLCIKSIEDIGQDYAKTIACWHESFQANLQAIQALGFDQRFIKMFAFYFCYCEAGFLSGYISNIQVVMEKQGV